MSYVKIELTAMYSAELAEVTAMKISSSVAAAPPFPNNAPAAFGRTNPAVTSASGIREGNVGKTGLDYRARQDSPIVVAAGQRIESVLVY